MTKKNFTKNATDFLINGKDPEGIKPKAGKDLVKVPEGYRLVKETKSARLQLLIRPTTKAGLKDAAAEKGISLNNLVNEIFERYLKIR